MNIFSVRKGLFKDIKISVLGLVAVLLLCTIFTPATVTAATTGNLIYSVNGEVFYKDASSTGWTTLSIDSSEMPVSNVTIGENGCVVYQGSSGSLYYKSSPTSTNDIKVVDISVGLYNFDINKHCAVVWSQVDDWSTYESTLWYKSAPLATAIEIEHNSPAWLSGVGVTDNGGAAWLDANLTLWYRSAPTAPIEQISGEGEAMTFRINGNGALAWQDAYSMVYYRSSPSAETVIVSEPDVASFNTISLDKNGGVAFTCNTSAIYYRPAGSSITTKLTADYFSSRGVLTADGTGFFHENIEAGLAYTDLSTMTTTDLTDAYLVATSIDAY